MDREPDDGRRRWPASRGAIAAALPWALGVNALTGWLGYRARTVSRSGAIVGALVGAIIYVGGGAGAWVLLLVTFLAASVTSRLGLARKERLGIAEERGGRRGAGNAIANCGVAALAAIAAVDDAVHGGGAGRAGRGADRRRQRHGRQRDRQGVGTVDVSRHDVQPREAGHAGRDVARRHGRRPARGVRARGRRRGARPDPRRPPILIVVVGATAGALVESALGATLEGPGILNNDMLNFINTAVAAAVALALL